MLESTLVMEERVGEGMDSIGAKRSLGLRRELRQPGDSRIQSISPKSPVAMRGCRL